MPSLTYRNGLTYRNSFTYRGIGVGSGEPGAATLSLAPVVPNNEYVAGNPVIITASFVNELTGANADPTVIELGIQLGIETPTLLSKGSLTQTAVGVYYYVLDTTSAPGEYGAQVQGTGDLLAVSDLLKFTVLPPSIVGLT